MAGEIRVLYVGRSGDDEPPVSLERASLHVDTATGADEIRDRVATASVDCIVAACTPAETDGLVGAIHETPPDCPVVFLDGDEDATERILAAVGRSVPERTRAADRHLDRVTDGTVVFDDDLTIASCHGSAVDLLAVPPGDAVGTGVEAAFPDAPDAMDRNLRQALAESTPATFEAAFSRLDARYRVDAVPVDGSLSVCFVDVSERAAVESAFRALFDTVPDPVAHVDTDGEFLAVNEAMARGLGASREAVVGSHVGDHLSEDVVVTGMERGRTAVETGDVREYEDEWDGRSFHVAVAPVDAPGERDSFLVVGRETTALERTEAVLDQEQRLAKSVLNSLNDVFFLFDVQGNLLRWNRRADEVGRYSVSEMTSMQITDFFPSEQAERVEAAFEEVLADGRARFEATLQTADGESVAYEFTGALSEDADGDAIGVSAVGRDVSERKRREETLDALHEATRDLMGAATKEEICDVAVEAADDVLGFPLTSIHLLDPDDDVLRQVASTDAARDVLGDVPDFERSEGLVWETFEEGAVRCYRDVRTRENVYDADTPIRSEMQLPIGDYGVLITGTTSVRRFGEYEIDFGRVLAANTEAALVRADREEELAEQRADLASLNRVNAVIRDVNQSLVGASTREEIESDVCERLAEFDGYRFAWIGEPIAASQEVRPRASAGVEEGYLDEITIPIEGGNEYLTATAIRTRTVQVAQNIAENPRFERWRDQALERGYRSAAAIPLAYDSTVYGVLHVYADAAGAFDEQERAVLGELGETIGHAINAAESKKVLATDSITELEFRISSSEHFFTTVSREIGCTISHEGTVSQSDGSLLQFATVEDALPEQVVSLAEQSRVIEHVRLVSERGGQSLLEFVFSGPSVVEKLADYGAMVRSMTATDGEIRVTTELATTTNVRPVVDAFQREFPDAELLAQRERDRQVRTTQDIRAAFDEALTDKQRAALRVAYRSGFFEWPRESSGEEVADSLDVSPPTFHQHLRVAERKLLEAFFEAQLLSTDPGP